MGGWRVWLWISVVGRVVVSFDGWVESVVGTFMGGWRVWLCTLMDGWGVCLLTLMGGWLLVGNVVLGENVVVGRPRWLWMGSVQVNLD